MKIKEYVSQWLPLLIWTIIIFLASSNPAPEKLLPPRWIEPCFANYPANQSCSEYLGRFLHVIEYAILSFLTCRAIFWDIRTHRLTTIFAILIAIELFALSDEIHQLFVPGRNFQLIDLGLDLLGGVIGLMIFLLITRKSISSITRRQGSNREQNLNMSSIGKLPP